MVTKMNMRLKGPVCERRKLRNFVAPVALRFRHESAPLEPNGAYPAGVIATASCWGA